MQLSIGGSIPLPSLKLAPVKAAAEGRTALHTITSLPVREQTVCIVSSVALTVTGVERGRRGLQMCRGVMDV